MNARSTVEAEHAARRWAVPAAVIAAILPFLGSIIPTTIVGKDVQNRLSAVVRLNEKSTAIVVTSIVAAFGLLALSAALWHLYRAIRARRPEFPAALRFLPLLGPPLAAVAQVGSQAVAADAAGKFASSSPQTLQRIDDLFSTSAAQFFAYLGFLAGFLMAAAVIAFSVNAMRVGLLPKFVGYVGVFGGILTALPLIRLPIVLTFWLLALALLYSGRWVGPVPPAWETGQAEPWPTLAEMREQAERDKAAGGGRGAAPTPAPDPLPAAQPDAPERPGAARRKRKKRR